MILPVAEKFQGHMYFTMAEPDDTDGLLAQFDLVEMKGVAVAVYGHGGSKYVMPQAELTAQSLDVFVTDLLREKLVPFQKSQPKPARHEQHNSSSTIVVGATFAEIVLDETADVLIMLYSPTCPHCQQLLPAYEQLASKFAELKVDTVRIAKLNALENDPTPGYQVFSYPTIYLAPRGNKTSPVLYSQKVRAPTDFIRFVDGYGTTELPVALLELKHHDFPVVG
jgi:thiol-disulfide isomerase/thioredoxin